MFGFIKKNQVILNSIYEWKLAIPHITEYVDSLPPKEYHLHMDSLREAQSRGATLQDIATLLVLPLVPRMNNFDRVQVCGQVFGWKHKKLISEATYQRYQTVEDAFPHEDEPF